MRIISAAIAIAVASALCSTGVLASPIQYEEAFDTGLGGWTVVDAAGDRNGTQNILSNTGTGGADGGGFLTLQDVTGGFTYLVAPTALNGDLRGMTGSMFSFAVAHFAPVGGTRFIDSFGTVTIRSGNQSVSADAFSGDPDSTWREASVRFLASDFGVGTTAFDTILSNVTSFEVAMESYYGLVETVGFDNASVATVPLPPAGGMLVAGLLGLLGWRRVRAVGAAGS